MNNLYHNLDQRQARHVQTLKSGDEFVVLGMIEQPPEGYHFSVIEGNHYSWFAQDTGILCADKFKLPIPTGARVGLRETWKYCYMNGTFGYASSNPGYAYKVDNRCTGCALIDCPKFYKWSSSQCMPTEAIRNWYLVKSSRCNRVQNVTMKEIGLIFGDFIPLGLEDTYIPYRAELQQKLSNWFNAKYKGKYTWDDNPYFQIATLVKA